MEFKCSECKAILFRVELCDTTFKQTPYSSSFPESPGIELVHEGGHTDFVAKCSSCKKL
jgi:hypothetical protein